MSEFALLHFIRPWWLLLLPLAFLLPWLWKRTRRPSGDWTRACDPHLLRWLSVSQAGGRSRGGGRWLAGTALVISILAHWPVQAGRNCRTVLFQPGTPA